MVVPIELVWGIVVLIFGCIGIVRGFLKELGVTTVMLVLLFFITTFESRLTPMIAKVVVKVAPGELTNILAAFWVGSIAVTAFISYHGQTLAFEGTEPKGSLGTFFKLGIGLVNGYLIASSVWYYLDRLKYPFLHIRPEQLSSTANWLLSVSPPRLLAPYLLYLVVFLVLMRVIK